MRELPDDYFIDADDKLVDFMEKQGENCIREIYQSNQTNKENGYRLLSILIVGIGSSFLLLTQNPHPDFVSAGMRLAILQAVLAEYPASGFVLNPIDWAAIELTKDGEGRYIIAQPVNGSVARLWGLPVVETQAMAQNNFLTGAFSMAAQIFDRMEIEVLLSTENEDDFVRNMVTIRAEERLAMAVYRPEAFVTGQVTASSAG
ncbi:TPA: phage major capsid protein [Salmonella enterica subsp. diarizonae]